MTTATAPVPATVPGTYILLDPQALKPSSNPRRKPVAQERLAEIADSMRKHHVLEPLIVRTAGKDAYQVVAGDTRQKAALLAGLPLVPCIVRELNDVDMLELQIIENVQRNDMHPLDEGDAFRRLIDSKKHTVESLAATVGKSVRWLYNRLEFTKLIPSLRKAFVDEEITASHAELLARLDPADQKRIDNDPDDPDSFGDDDDGLWKWDFLGEDDDGVKKRRSVRSLRDVNDWIERHVRLNVQREAVQNQIPEVEDVLLEAARENSRVLQLASVFQLPKDPDNPKRFEGVLTDRHWKLAGGKSACEFAEKGVIVFGSGQGDVVEVCTKKKLCAKHWPEHQDAQKEKDATKRARLQQEQTKAREQYEREQAKRDADAKRFDRLHPVLKKHTVAALQKLKAPTPAILAALAARFQLRGVKTLNDLALALFAEHVQQLYRYAQPREEPQMRASAKLLGIDLTAVEREAFPDEHAAAKSPKPAKPARKAAPAKKGGKRR